MVEAVLLAQAARADAVADVAHSKLAQALVDAGVVAVRGVLVAQVDVDANGVDEGRRGLGALGRRLR